MPDPQPTANPRIRYLATLTGLSFDLLEKWLGSRKLPALENFAAEDDSDKKETWNDLALADDEVPIMGPILDDNMGDWLREYWGDVCCNPAQVRRDLKKIDGDVKLRIDSPGGNVWAASQIYTNLVEAGSKRKITANIDGLSASAATLVQLAAADVTISTLGTMMIHRASGFAFGSGKQIRSYGDFMMKEDVKISQLYADNSKLSAEEALEKMDAETWLTAEEAVELGFCSAVYAAEKKDETEDSEMEALAGNFNMLLNRGFSNNRSN